MQKTLLGQIIRLIKLKTRKAHAPKTQGRSLSGPPVRTQTHSVFLAYGGHAVPFAPMAFPTKASRKNFAFRSTVEALRKQAIRFAKARKEKFHPSHTASGKLRRKIQKGPTLGKLPGLGPPCLWGRCLPLYFAVSDLLIRRTTSVYKST